MVELKTYISNHQGGTHTSPRPHWLRGHIRQLPDKKVIVQPCLVNSLMVEGTRKIYRIKPVDIINRKR